MKTTDVVIVGGGPAGLMLALELGRRGIRCMLFDEKPGTAQHPRATSTQARTMEHYRRLGFASEIRALGLPADYATDIAYFTRYSRTELGRFRLPTSQEAAEMGRTSSESWATPELPHRCSQAIIEAVLRKHAERRPTSQIRYGWRVNGFRDLGDFVEVDVENATGSDAMTVQCEYLVGCDGARSMVRAMLGIRYAGESDVRRDFLGGKMCSTYFRCPELYSRIAGDRAWMYGAFNPQRRAVLVAINGVDEFVFHTQLRDEDCGSISEARGQEIFDQAMGCHCPMEVISRDPWIAGYALVAESYGSGRVFLAGDAAHLFTPTGGLGYNTGVEDAVNLGWKLAAVLQGWGGPQLLESYAAERMPMAQRNARIAKGFADSIGRFGVNPAIEEDSPAGEAARVEAGRYLAAHASKEFSIPGVSLGARYDGSPIVSEDDAPPQDTINEYHPSGVPGGRAPHFWLDGGRSLFDRFGPEWTLLHWSGRADMPAWQAEARELGIPLRTLDLRHEACADYARELYGADLALIRPDQHIAWRGGRHDDPLGALAHATGARVWEPALC